MLRLSTCAGLNRVGPGQVFVWKRRADLDLFQYEFYGPVSVCLVTRRLEEGCSSRGRELFFLVEIVFWFWYLGCVFYSLARSCSFLVVGMRFSSLPRLPAVLVCWFSPNANEPRIIRGGGGAICIFIVS